MGYVVIDGLMPHLMDVYRESVTRVPGHYGVTTIPTLIASDVPCQIEPTGNARYEIREGGPVYVTNYTGYTRYAGLDEGIVIDPKFGRKCRLLNSQAWNGGFLGFGVFYQFEIERVEPA